MEMSLSTLHILGWVKKQFLLSDPLRKLAKNALKEAKKKGGNKIIIK